MAVFRPNCIFPTREHSLADITEDAQSDFTSCTQSSDIDLVVTSDRISDRQRIEALRTIANILHDAGVAKNLQIIPSAKVPIVKFVTTLGDFAVDISINQINGIKTGEIVKGLVEQHVALRPFVLLVKTYLQQRRQNEVFTGGLGSYSIVLLVTSFLQVSFNSICN